MRRFFFITVAVISLFVSSCVSTNVSTDTADKTNKIVSQTPSIVGSYVDNYGTKQLIKNTQWLIGSETQPLTFTYTSVNNDTQTIVAENTFNEGSDFNFTGKFSQFNWTRFDDALWYCQIVFDAETEEEATSHPQADSSDPSQGGCGNFSWSKLISEDNS